MLGNTNVKDGINLNASVVSKVVEDGQSIVAGNFVQYKTSSCEIEIGSSAFSKLRHVSGDYYVALAGDNTIKLLKFDGANSEALDTYYDYPAYDLDTDENGHIFFISSNNYVRRLEIENDSLVHKQGIQTDLYCTSSTSGIYAMGNYIYTFLCSTTGSKPLYKNVLSNTNGVLAKSDSDTDTTSVDRDKEDFQKLIKLDGKFFSFYYTGSGSNRYMNVAVYTLYSSTPYRATHTLLDQATWHNPSVYGGNIIAQRSENTMGLLDVSTWNVVIVASTLPTQFNGGNLMQLSGEYIFAPYNYVGKAIIAKYDNSLSQIIAQSNEITMPFDGTDKVLTAFDALYIYATNGKKVCVYSYSDDYISLSQPIDVDYVRNWDGNYKLIGVAKQSGTAGDTIEVYVPTV